MYSAKHLSEAIRKKRKQVRDDGVENMVDTAPGPQMNPQDVYNEKQREQYRATMDTSEKSEAPSDPADESIADTSQSEEYLRRKSRLTKTFAKMGY